MAEHAHDWQLGEEMTDLKGTLIQMRWHCHCGAWKDVKQFEVSQDS